MGKDEARIGRDQVEPEEYEQDAEAKHDRRKQQRRQQEGLQEIAAGEPVARDRDRRRRAETEAEHGDAESDDQAVEGGPPEFPGAEQLHVPTEAPTRRRNASKKGK